MHPGLAEEFEWEEGNERELAAHHVRPSEVEAVFLNGPIGMRNKQGRSGDWKMVGFTDAGRALTLIVLVKDAGRVLRPITGWDAPRGDRSRYLEK